MIIKSVALALIVSVVCAQPALAQAVISLMQDRETRHRMGQRALEKTKSELSWTTIARQTAEVYRLAMGEM